MECFTGKCLLKLVLSCSLLPQPSKQESTCWWCGFSHFLRKGKWYSTDYRILESTRATSCLLPAASDSRTSNHEKPISRDDSPHWLRMERSTDGIFERHPTASNTTPNTTVLRQLSNQTLRTLNHRLCIFKCWGWGPDFGSVSHYIQGQRFCCMLEDHLRLDEWSTTPAFQVPSRFPNGLDADEMLGCCWYTEPTSKRFRYLNRLKYPVRLTERGQLLHFRSPWTTLQELSMMQLLLWRGKLVWLKTS